MKLPFFTNFTGKCDPEEHVAEFQSQMSSASQRQGDEHETPFNASVGKIFLEIEDNWMLPRPPKKKTTQYKKDMSKYCQYHKDHGHDTDDCRHLKIQIKKLIERAKLKEYVHK
ncbi:hypothetical protein LIER_16517 [Lithospermum erythrorhizon]|uniref:Reverse transcriptase domain-containing protein n=1 Tax=Lithospermum erythrorhizon TaxID=34254 RepID=A0AAV3Q793_LITER